MSALPRVDSRRALPLPLTPLVGREHELIELEDLLHEPAVRLLTLVGPGGVDKTRLALHLADRVEASFRDGACFVPLNPIQDTELLLPTVAQAVGVLDTRGVPVFDELVGALRGQEMLLVLDNFEHLTAAAGLVSDLIMACPGLTVLATSRAPLDVYGEREFPVDPLPLPAKGTVDPARYQDWADAASVRLFVERATEVRPGFRATPENIADIVEICRRLDGLPLAIELSAARVKVMPPALLRQHLSRRLQVLTGGVKSRSPRFQTMRSTIAWSYDLLSPEQQRMFRRLGVFAGGFSLEAAAAVLGHVARGRDEGSEVDADDPFSVLDRVTELMDQSLVRQVEQDGTELRFDMLQTIQEFARERLAEQGELPDVQCAHATYMVQLVEQAGAELTGTNQTAWFARLELEHDNLRAALAWAIAERDAPLAHRLAAPLWRFWWNHGHLTEGRQWFTQALDLGTATLTRERAWALYGAGQLAETQGDYDQARSLYQEGLAAARTLDERPLVARMLDGLGCIAHDRGRYDEAIALHEEARGHFEATRDQRGLAGCLHNIGTVRYYQGNFDAADAMYTDSLAILRELRDQRSIAMGLGNLGALAFARGDYERARQLQEECLEVMRALGDEIGIASALSNLGGIQQRNGDYAKAAELNQEALALCEAVGAWRHAAIIRYQLGQVARAMGDDTDAAMLLTESLVAFREFDDLASISSVIEALGAVARSLGAPRCGVRLLAAADALRTSIGAGLEASEVEQHELDLKALRADAGDAFAAVWEEGAGAPLDEIVAEALEVRELAAVEQGDPVIADVAGRFGLSRREVEVLRLFAMGRSTQQMAEMLGISPATVTQHVGNLLTRLGVDSRAELAAVAFKHGLV